MKAVGTIEQKILFLEEKMFFTILMQVLRLLKAFSGKRPKRNLSLGLWEVAEYVESQVVAT